MIDAIRDNLLHSNGLPVREGPVDIRSAIMLAGLDLPVWSLLVQLALVVLADPWILLLSYLTYPRRPDEHRHYVVAADPTIVPLIRVDAPLSHSRH